MSTVNFPILGQEPPLDHEGFAAHKKLEKRLRKALRGDVQFDLGSRALYATDSSNYRQLPVGVIFPRDAKDVAAALKVCRGLGVAVLPRGAGTSLAGQTANVAVVFDYSKYMNRLTELDPAARLAIVEPGIVLDRLREAAEEHHLTYAPDPATHSRCTLGGMMGNNSCGVHGLLGGKVVDNVESLDIILYDGTRMTVGRTSEQELIAKIHSGGRVGEIYAGLARIRDRYGNLIRQKYPKIPRRVSGYNLDELLPENGFNVARALIGSEGTCVNIVSATLNLVSSPPCRVLTALGFSDVFQAAYAVPMVLEHKPIGLEGMDDLLIDFMRRKSLALNDIGLLPQGGGFLLVEMGAWSAEEAQAKAEELISAAKSWKLSSTLTTPPVARIYTAEEAARVWAVRESALGATVFVPGEPEGWEGWEDAGIPPDQLGNYLRRLKMLMGQYGYRSAMYGHFGQGCVHLRINFDFRSERGLMQFREFIDRAADLVLTFGGSLSGEHGDGQARAALLPKMFGEDLMGALREFKQLWDPRNLMNPGKLVDAVRVYDPTENLRHGPNQPHTEVKPIFAFAKDGGSFEHATERCVGVGACRKTTGGVMCPSFRATGDEQHSTRGRARLLWEMLSGDLRSQGFASPAVNEALNLCLSCKACKSECPAQVDMAQYKSEYLAQRYRGKPHPLHHYVFGYADKLAKWGSLAPGATNAILSRPLSSWFIKKLVGVAGERQFPMLADMPFTRARKNSSSSLYDSGTISTRKAQAGSPVPSLSINTPGSTPSSLPPLIPLPAAAPVTAAAPAAVAATVSAEVAQAAANAQAAAEAAQAAAQAKAAAAAQAEAEARAAGEAQSIAEAKAAAQAQAEAEARAAKDAHTAAEAHAAVAEQAAIDAKSYTAEPGPSAQASTDAMKAVAAAAAAEAAEAQTAAEAKAAAAEQAAEEAKAAAEAHAAAEARATAAAQTAAEAKAAVDALPAVATTAASAQASAEAAARAAAEAHAAAEAQAAAAAQAAAEAKAVAESKAAIAAKANAEAKEAAEALAPLEAESATAAQAAAEAKSAADAKTSALTRANAQARAAAEALAAAEAAAKPRPEPPPEASTQAPGKLSGKVLSKVSSKSRGRGQVDAAAQAAWLDQLNRAITGSDALAEAKAAADAAAQAAAEAAAQSRVASQALAAAETRSNAAAKAAADAKAVANAKSAAANQAASELRAAVQAQARAEEQAAAAAQAAAEAKSIAEEKAAAAAQAQTDAAAQAAALEQATQARAAAQEKADAAIRAAQEARAFADSHAAASSAAQNSANSAAQAAAEAQSAADARAAAAVEALAAVVAHAASLAQSAAESQAAAQARIDAAVQAAEEAKAEAAARAAAVAAALDKAASATLAAAGAKTAAATQAAAANQARAAAAAAAAREAQAAAAAKAAADAKAAAEAEAAASADALAQAQAEAEAKAAAEAQARKEAQAAKAAQAARAATAAATRRPRERQTVLLWADTWNNYYHPQALGSAEALLTEAGFDVRVPKKHICCGRPLYDFGMLGAAKKYLSRVMKQLEQEIDDNIPIIFLEPSCASVFRDELLELFPGDDRASHLQGQVWLLADWLAAKAPEFVAGRLEGKRVLIHGHCHHKAVFGGPKNEIALLRTAGATVEPIDTTCCGMAGPFGFEADKFEVSKTIANLGLLGPIEDASSDTLVIADGFSCREQIAQLGKREAVHFAEALATAKK